MHMLGTKPLESSRRCDAWGGEESWKSSLAAMLVAVDLEAASNSIVPLISTVHYAILFLALFLIYRLSQAVSRSGVPVHCGTRCTSWVSKLLEREDHFLIISISLVSKIHEAFRLA